MNKLVIYLIGIFFIIGGIDYLLGNKFKLGEKFQEGIKSMGTLALSMVGIYSLTPVIAEYISKFIVPISKILKLDPSIFSGTLLAVDMGGYNLSKTLALDNSMGVFSGIVLASNIGATFSFSIPLALGIIDKDDFKFFFKGLIIGIMATPFGCIAGGLLCDVDKGYMLYNMIPIILFSFLLSIGLIKIPDKLINIFNIIGKLILILSSIGLLAQGSYMIFNMKIFKNMIPFSEAIEVVGKIAFILGGAYPMLLVVNKFFYKTLQRIGNKIGINIASATGVLGNLANNILVFKSFKEMDYRGKIINSSLAVSAPFMLGGQLAFVSGMEPSMTSAFIVSKLIGGILSIFMSLYILGLEEYRCK